MMQLGLDMSRHLLDVYTKFQIAMPKHVEESPKIINKSALCKNNCQNSENKIFARKGTDVCREIAVYRIEGFILINKVMNAKKK